MLQDIQQLDKKDTRSGFGEAIVKAPVKTPNVVALTPNLAGPLKWEKFSKSFPVGSIKLGLPEPNRLGVAPGLTLVGKLPFLITLLNFFPLPC